jgi:RecG-like helicase
MGLFKRTPAVAVAPVIEVVEGAASSIADVTARDYVTIRGTVTQIRTIPRAGLPSLAVVVEDSSGKVAAIWSGRRAIGGIALGRRIDIVGTAVQGSHGLEFHNPAYTLRAGQAH